MMMMMMIIKTIFDDDDDLIILVTNRERGELRSWNLWQFSHISTQLHPPTHPYVPPLQELLDIPQILHLPDIFNILNFLDIVLDFLNALYSRCSLIFLLSHESLLIFLVHPFFSFKKSCQRKEFRLQLMQDLAYTSPPPVLFCLILPHTSLSALSDTGSSPHMFKRNIL